MRERSGTPAIGSAQIKRKRIEESFGWLKTIALMRKVRHRGIFKVGWVFTFAAAAYNLVRMPQPGVVRGSIRHNRRSKCVCTAKTWLSDTQTPSPKVFQPNRNSEKRTRAPLRLPVFQQTASTALTLQARRAVLSHLAGLQTGQTSTCAIFTGTTRITSSAYPN